ncbi:MAG: serine hydrolase [Acidimicrobiia bacterium]|nr:serine hydrolase [Acidimicrobiia bacterium]
MRRRVMAVVCALAVVLAACAGDDVAEDATATVDDERSATTDGGPDEPGDGDSSTEDAAWDWEVVDPSEVGMDAATLEQARSYAFEEVEHTQGVVVIREGRLVAEWYASDADQDSWAASWSVAKSFTSALVGIAIDEGLIESVDEPMTTWYPEWEGSPREDITLRDVLQMASGLDFTESYDPADLESSDIIQLVLASPDQLTYAADRPELEEPGTVFNYSSGDTLLLSGVLEQVTGMSAAEYAEQKLFGPLGIEQVEWWEDAVGTTLTYCCLDTTSRDFARFGQLYLDGGAWQGEQVVPAAWVEVSVEPSPAADYYGFQWWLTGVRDDDLPDDLYSARGHDGQFIYVIPSLDLVVVRNGTYIKHDGEPVADPSLYEFYPSGLVEDRGTLRPSPGWSDAEFLAPIIESIGSSSS